MTHSQWVEAVEYACAWVEMSAGDTARLRLMKGALKLRVISFVARMLLARRAI